MAELLRERSVIDLFCGAGGLSTSFERAGFHTIAAVDHDFDCVSTLRANQASGREANQFGQKYLAGAALLQADICDITRSDLIPSNASATWRPDVLSGGPPCQPFSSAGTGRALDDPRGQLFITLFD